LGDKFFVSPSSMDKAEEKRLEMLLVRLKEVESDLENVVTLSNDIKGLDRHLKKLSGN